ncbi:MAG: FlgD immunoglobulin-like domain containing protein, partial [Verrucomicrobiota bacterium]
MTTPLLRTIGRIFRTTFVTSTVLLTFSSSQAQTALASASSFIAIDKGSMIVPESIEFFVRSELAANMTGATFEGSNQSIDEGFETIHTISASPAGGDTIITLTGDQPYRYFRYVAPDTESPSIAFFDLTGIEYVEEVIEPGPTYAMKYAASYNAAERSDLEELVIDTPTFISILPDTGISRVEFYHNVDGQETLVHTERAKPYDYFGTDYSILPEDLPEDGLNLIAIVTTVDGQSERLEGTLYGTGATIVEEIVDEEVDTLAPDGYVELVIEGRTLFGLDPAWADGREFDKAFDGEASTYYDYAYGRKESFVGFDNVDAQVPVSITFAPRDRFAGRMVGGQFQGSNESPYSGYETIYEITEAPAYETQVVSLSTSKSYRYYRYLSPARSYGNIAEFDIAFDTLILTPEPIVDVVEKPVEEIIEEPAATYALKYASTYNAEVRDDLSELIVGGDTYISILPETDISTVMFYHLENGTESLVHTERVKPYDYFGADHAVTADQIPESGLTLIAVINKVDGTSETLKANLTKPVEEVVFIVEEVIEPETILSEEELVIVAEPGEKKSGESIETDSVSTDNPIELKVDADDVAAVVIEFSIETAGQVSAAVYDEDDRLIRTLLRGEVLEAGNHFVVWDGLNSDGDAVDAGNYTFKLLSSDGLKSEFLTNLGINPKSASYDTWVGNHEGGASSVAVDATGVYIAAEITETAPVLLKQSLDGETRLWTKDRIDVTNGRFQGGAALASDGEGTLYMLQQNGYLQVIDAVSGKLMDSWDILPSGITRGSDLFIYMHEADEMAGADLDARGDTVVISYQSSNLVAWIDPASGNFKSQFTVSAPRGLTVTNDEEVLVLSGSALYGLRFGQSRTLIGSGLEDAQRLTYDATSNTLLISFGIEGSRVQRYSMDGELLESYGKEDGRSSGTYHAEDFYGVRDISADGEGGFYVTEPEAQPRRLARFDSKGAHLDDWYGGQNYYAWAEPDPRTPGRAWMHTTEGFVHIEFDLDTGDWKVLEAWLMEDMADGLVTDLSGAHGRWRVLYKGDDCYLISELTPQVLAYKEGSLQAVSISSNDADQLEAAIKMTGETSNPDSFRWLDANADGRPQKSEFTFSKYGEVPTGTRIRDDFSYVGFDRLDESLVVLKSEALWSELGPYYPIGRETDFDNHVASTPTLERSSSRGTNVYASPDGAYYAHYNLSVENHGVYWPTHWASISRFVRWDAEG